MARLPLPVLGIDLLSGETDLLEGAVRAAVNVDIDRVGQFSRRSGYSTVLKRADCSALYAFDRRLLMVCAGELVQVDAANYTTSSLARLGRGPVDFCEHNGDLYVIGPSGLWRLRRGSISPTLAGVAIPESLPAIEPHPVGTLTPGQYTVALSLVDDFGEESPATVCGSVRLSAGLKLAGLPAMPGMRWRLYMTAPDGQALYLAEEFEALLPEHVATIYPNGAPCQTLHLDHFEGGHSVRAWADRLFIAQGDVLWYSEAMRPNLTSKRHNFVRFVGAIRFIEPVEGGLFVGDDRGVWFLSGAEPSAWSQSFVSSVRAISGSSTQLPGSHLAGGEAATNSAIWLSENGYMNGLPGGTVVPLQPGRIQIDHTVAGRTVLALRNGVRQAITLTATVPRSANGVAIDTTSKNKSQSHLNRSLV